MRLAAPREPPKINHLGTGRCRLRRVGQYIYRFTILSSYKIGEGGIGWRGNFENELFHRSIIRSTPRLAAAGAARLEGKKTAGKPAVFDLKQD
jgi:hypothetical protein